MVSLPWYLLAAGIVLVIIGFLLASVSGPSKQGPVVHARMRDEDIVRELNRAQRVPASSLVILAGFLCILVSIGWRMARMVF